LLEDIETTKMFYLEEQIDRSLMCPRCRARYVDPRILVPCCETLCQTCIDHLTDTNNNRHEINCYFCRQKHKIPANGFAPNKTIIQLLNVCSAEVYRGAHVETFKTNLSRIQELTSEFESGVEQAAHTLQQHCGKLKADVDEFTETKKKQFDEMRDDLWQKVNSYEQDCQSMMQNKWLCCDGVEQASAFAQEWKGYLSSPDIAESVVSRRNREAEHHLGELEELLTQLKSATGPFKWQLLELRENRDETITVELHEQIGFLQLEEDYSADHQPVLAASPATQSPTNKTESTESPGKYGKLSLKF
jgi:hypothetical protein